MASVVSSSLLPPKPWARTTAGAGVRKAGKNSVASSCTGWPSAPAPTGTVSTWRRTAGCAVATPTAAPASATATAAPPTDRTVRRRTDTSLLPVLRHDGGGGPGATTRQFHPQSDNAGAATGVPASLDGTVDSRRAHRVRNVAGDCGRAVTSYLTGNLLISVICGTRLGGVPVVPARQPRLCCLQRRSGWGPAAIGGPDLPNSGQRFGDVVISGLAHVDAPHIVTSAEIEEQLAPTMERMRIRPGLLAGVGGHGARHLTDVPESALLHSG